MAHLRTARQMRQADSKSGLGQIVDTVSIRERPAEAIPLKAHGLAPSQNIWSLILFYRGESGKVFTMALLNAPRVTSV
jgi:hypothetical protein